MSTPNRSLYAWIKEDDVKLVLNLKEQMRSVIEMDTPQIESR